MSTTSIPSSSLPSEKIPGNTSEQTQQQTYKSRADKIKKHWKQLIGVAASKWDKLTDEELKKINGNEQKLIALLKDRYNIPQDDANHQVKRFFANNLD